MKYELNDKIWVVLGKGCDIKIVPGTIISIIKNSLSVSGYYVGDKFNRRIGDGTGLIEEKYIHKTLEKAKNSAILSIESWAEDAVDKIQKEHDRYCKKILKNKWE